MVVGFRPEPFLVDLHDFAVHDVHPILHVGRDVFREVVITFGKVGVTPLENQVDVLPPSVTFRPTKRRVAERLRNLVTVLCIFRDVNPGVIEHP